MLCLVELTRTNATVSEIQAVEEQAYTVCIAYLKEHQDRPIMYAMTCFGTKAKAWSCTRGSQHLEPMFGSESLPDPDAYIEAHSTHTKELVAFFSHMKKFLPTARQNVENGNTH